MKLKVLGSSSLGNCYLLEDDDECLIIEAGVPIREIKKAMEWSFRKVVGCLVTHSHLDHSKAMKDLHACGVKTYSLPETIKERTLSSPFAKSVREGESFKLGGFEVHVMPANHDVPIVSFIIFHPTFGSLLFATDTYSLPYKPTGIANFLIEANYDKDFMIQGIERGIIDQSYARRVVNSHMSLEKTLQVVMDSGSKDIRNVVLLHLSDSNSRADDFLQQMQQVTGVPVYIAEKGLELTL